MMYKRRPFAPWPEGSPSPYGAGYEKYFDSLLYHMVIGGPGNNLQIKKFRVLSRISKELRDLFKYGHLAAFKIEVEYYNAETDNGITLVDMATIKSGVPIESIEEFVAKYRIKSIEASKIVVYSEGLYPLLMAMYGMEMCLTLAAQFQEMKTDIFCKTLTQHIDRRAEEWYYTASIRLHNNAISFFWPTYQKMQKDRRAAYKSLLFDSKAAADGFIKNYMGEVSQ